MSADNPITEGLEDDGDDLDATTVSDGYIRSVVAGFIASGVVGFITWVAGGWLSVVDLIRTEAISIGGLIMEQSSTVGTEITDLVRLPITLIGELAATAGPFAPLLSALIFAVVAVITGAIALALWRLVVIVT